MKKLMMMAAVACAVVLANAASISWSLTKNSFANADGTSSTGGDTVSLIQFATAAAADTAYAGLKDGSLTLSDLTVVGSAATSTNKKSYGQISSTLATSSDLTAGTTAYYALFVQQGDSFLLSGLKDGKAYDTDPDLGKAVDFASTEFSTSADSRTGWTHVGSPTPPGPTPGDIPEPTSGLLLALGGAMLALRRKQK